MKEPSNQGEETKTLGCRQCGSRPNSRNQGPVPSPSSQAGTKTPLNKRLKCAAVSQCCHQVPGNNSLRIPILRIHTILLSYMRLEACMLDATLYAQLSSAIPCSGVLEPTMRYWLLSSSKCHQLCPSPQLPHSQNSPKYST